MSDLQIGGEVSEWRLESRPVQKLVSCTDPKHDQILRRDIYCKGDHNPYCQLCEDGWVCDVLCTIEDMKQAISFENVVDKLVEVEKLTTRHWFRVDWQMVRVSIQQKFINGRTMAEDLTYFRDTWHEGATFTKWGARREMRKHEG